MAGSGFPQRFKGKVAIAQLWLGAPGSSKQITASGNDINSLTNASVTVSSTVVGSTLGPIGVSIINTTALSIFKLADPVPGGYKTIYVSSGSTAWGVSMTSTGVTLLGASTVAGGNSLTNTIKSTVTLAVTEVELYGLSTTQYLFLGVAPSTLSHLAYSSAT